MRSGFRAVQGSASQYCIVFTRTTDTGRSVAAEFCSHGAVATAGFTSHFFQRPLTFWSFTPEIFSKFTGLLLLRSYRESRNVRVRVQFPVQSRTMLYRTLHSSGRSPSPLAKNYYCNIQRAEVTARYVCSWPLSFQNNWISAVWQKLCSH